MPLSHELSSANPLSRSAAHIVLTSDLIGLFPERYARQVATTSGATVFPIDLDLPRLPISQAWNIRHDNDPAHQWIRNQIHLAAANSEKWR